ncbi:MAG: hypothetical protein NTW03_16175 [Verrucomicrobia bacterium]|nr:hypothetical protein [Verrucomicrobiota bacterium]
MRRLKFICFCLALSGWMVGSAYAQSYMAFEFDGQKVMARPVAYKDTHIQLAFQGGGTTNVPWGHLSQASLRSLLPLKYYGAFAAPFIDVPPQEPPPKPKITIQEVTRMDRPSRGGLTASPVMYLVFFLLYVANIYAGYEIAQYRQRPPVLVCCLSAIGPVMVPIIFLSMPEAGTQQAMAEEAPIEGTPEEVAPGETTAAETAPAPDEAAAPTEEVAAIPEQPETVYHRGQFTFNRRFFETKLAGFLKVVPGEAEMGMVVAIKSARGNYAGPRLTRLSPNELTLHVVKAGASQDVVIPFGEISEVKIRHQNAE